MANKIFINCRRKLNLVEAQLLQKVLQRHFGKARVFLDISGLEGGEHWLHTLEHQVDASAAMVSLIGGGWADVTDEEGARRLDNPNDFVRFEIARAFARKIPVLPLRLDGAEIPDTADLPLNLRQLAFHQAMLLRRESFDDDGDKIARRLKDLIAEARHRGAPRWVLGVSAAAALAAGIAAGPAVQTGVGLLQPRDPALRDALSWAEERASEAHGTAMAARKGQKEAETNLLRAQRELDLARAELKSAQVALSIEQEKHESAEGRIKDLGSRLNAALKGAMEGKVALVERETALLEQLDRASKAEAELAKLRAQPPGASGDAAKPEKKIVVPAGPLRPRP
jgi:hypothetical protein